MKIEYSVNELLAACISVLLRDDELAFIGTGSSGRAYTLAVGIPMAACALAQLTHAPGLSVYWGNLLTPSVDRFPQNKLQDTFTMWPAAASFPDASFKQDLLTREAFDVSFDSGAQIDRYGNLNITAIGRGLVPKTRLVGCLAQTEHLAFVRNPIIIADLSARTFVDSVDYMTSVGHYRGYNSRTRLGLPGDGPRIVMTDKAIFDFEPMSKQMRLISLHEDVLLDEVLGAMGFKPLVSDNLTMTQRPSQAQISLLRTKVDPNGLLLLN